MGLEKYEHLFKPNFSGKHEDPKYRAEQENRMMKELDQESQKLKSRAEAKQKWLEEHVDPEVVESYVHMIRTLEKMKMDDTKKDLLESFKKTLNEPTMNEINRRLAEETEDDDSQQ